MDKVKLPALLQLFPANALGNAKWPADFDNKADYTLDVRLQNVIRYIMCVLT
ncbi:unnamed protein product [Choristocarpus tenellus]